VIRAARQFLLAIAAVGLLVSCGGGNGPGVVHLYDHAPVPSVPDRTSVVTADWVSGGKGLSALPNGQYWADLVSLHNGSLVFEVSQALFGPACEAVLDAARCLDGYAPVPDPHGPVTVPPGTLTIVSVAAADRQNFAVTSTELVQLLGGGAPSAPAPGGFRYSPYPYLLTVQHGVAVEAHQVWAAGIT